MRQLFKFEDFSPAIKGVASMSIPQGSPDHSCSKFPHKKKIEIYALKLRQKN